MDSGFFQLGSCKSKAELNAIEALISAAAMRGVAAARKESLEAASNHGSDAQRIRALVSVIADLISHGWRIELAGKDILASVGAANLEESGREYVRRIQLGQREHQLQKHSVREFIRSMERKRLGPKGWISIFSLTRDGTELANALQAQGKNSSLVPDIISPYIQVIEGPDQTCELTGLRLMDIWRYFRYTWAMPYNSVPGRSMLLLVRDAVVENHPIIGIAALGSAIAQLSGRDKWIGWTPTEFLHDIDELPTGSRARWVTRQLREAIAGIYKADLVKKNIVTRTELSSPTDETISSLRVAAKRAWAIHRKFPSRKDHKSRAYTGSHWKRQAVLPLFMAKRCEVLARLLQVKKALNDCDYTPTIASLRRLTSSPAGRRAIEILARTAKAQHQGINMLDITICGAIPPYNPILGGKLVALLLCSPEIVGAYRRRYNNTPSVIASSVAGHSVCRRPRLVLLGTTSLYGERLNQYHRVQVPAGVAGGKTPIRYIYLGESSGFGSSHFCRETVEEIQFLLSQSSKGRRVNSIFGEGVSPRLRKIRDGLDLLGFHSDVVLKHGNPRLVYGVPLASNFREVLLGLTHTPKYSLPQGDRKHVSDCIARYWAERWLSPRLANHPEVLNAVAVNDVRIPDRHAARVQLPNLISDTLPLFA
jgi:uncharacterized protein DUF4338